MAFGDTGIIDDFNRSDEGPPPDSTWTNLYGGAHFEVVSNEIQQQGAGDGGDYFNDETFGPDCEVFLTIVSTAPAIYPAVALRITSPGSSWDGYRVQ